jgi:cytoskeletal protein RodZ
VSEEEEEEEEEENKKREKEKKKKKKKEKKKRRRRRSRKKGLKFLFSTLFSYTFNLRAYFSFGRRTNPEQHVRVYFLYRAIIFYPHNHL